MSYRELTVQSIIGATEKRRERAAGALVGSGRIGTSVGGAEQGEGFYQGWGLCHIVGNEQFHPPSVGVR